MKPTTEQAQKATVSPAMLMPTNVLIYEYGARLDQDSHQKDHDQIFRGHTLYNELIAAMHDVVKKDVTTAVALNC